MYRCPCYSIVQSSNTKLSQRSWNLAFLHQILQTNCSLVLVHMLAAHSDIPILFKLAADWELDDCRNVEKARNHLKNGLQIHKKCAMLYLDLFRVQLIYINKKIIEEHALLRLVRRRTHSDRI
ncbi:U3 small nucleolar RNA-associated protein 6 homolog isoform X3 [Nilaparvata lugens]|uniref:U3 small nucleolar RNA-associated protein 6 homolog isoform X3 n=1 Tax=Nilaparvata lugens TaxID=108931 RepID=UPI00193E66D1|nr:U3 small nucleolar RNA-associated protein 6 homolog isoform X3 [Nilaparvata lugens]